MKNTRVSHLVLVAATAGAVLFASPLAYADEAYPVMNNTPHEIDGIYFFTATPQSDVLNWIGHLAPIPAGELGEMDPLVECSFDLVLTSGDMTALLPDFDMCDFPDEMIIPEDAFGQ